MALAKKQSKSSTIIIVSVVAMIVGVVGYFVFTKIILNGDVNTNGFGARGDRKGVLNFNAEIFKDPRLTGLKSYEASIEKNVNGGQPFPFQ